jgi:hypothetical protein
LDENGNEIDMSADFIIKIRHTPRMGLMNTEYFLPNDGKLYLDVMSQDKGVDLKWGHLYYTEFNGNVHYGEGVNYTVLATKDKRARLDTQCALVKLVSSRYIMASFNTDGKNKFNFKMPNTGEHYYVNVIATVKSQFEEEAEFIPYKPVELFIPARSFMSRLILRKFNFLFTFLIIVIFIVVVLSFLAGGLYFYRKSKEVEHRIEYEMADVRSTASVGRTIEMATIDKKDR